MFVVINDVPINVFTIQSVSAKIDDPYIITYQMKNGSFLTEEFDSLADLQEKLSQFESNG